MTTPAFQLQQSEPITQGTLQTSTGKVLPLEHTAVKARIEGPVASVDLHQVFRNDTDGPIEAVYLFPFPHEASVFKMSFKIGERVVKGVIKEKEEAKRAYEAARREGRAATLLEQDRPNLFTLSVANVPPGQKIEVDLGYQEVLGFDDGEWRFVFPMVAAERYHAGTPTGLTSSSGVTATDQVRDASRIRPPRKATGQRAADIELELELQARDDVETPESPSHDVRVEALAAGGWKVRLAPGDSLPNRDFVLAWKAARAGVRPRAFFERKADKPGTFLLVLTPPAPERPGDPADPRVEGEGLGRTVRCGNCRAPLGDAGDVQEVAGIGPAWHCRFCGAVVSASIDGRVAAAARPRDVVFLVDRSCSMRGASLPQARKAVQCVLEHLGEKDRVQLFAFDHERLPFDGNGASFQPLSKDLVARIDTFLGGLSARGGTELEEALERVAKLPADADHTRVVVLMTDGATGNEARLLRRAPELLGQETRLYVLGIGPAVNRYLVDRLARAGGGASSVLLPLEEVDTVVPRFARRVRDGGPLLTNLRLSWDDAMPVDVYPNPIPVLFGGQPVRLLGRFNGEGPSKLVLTGTTALGAPFRQEVDVTLPESASDIQGLERLWARMRIDSRLDRLAQAPEEAAEIRIEVTGLALKHSLMSPYTSLVAEDSERSVEGPARRVEVELEGVADDMPAATDCDALREECCEPAPECCKPAPAMACDAPDLELCAKSDSSFFGGAPGAPMAAPPPPAPAMPARMRSAPSPVPLPSRRPTRASPSAAPPAAKEGVGAKLRRVLGGGSDEPTPVRPRPTGSSESYPSDVLQQAKQRVPGEIDLVFCVDETGSMGSYIEEVKSRLLEIIEAVKSAPLCRSLRMGLVGYRDHPPQDNSFASRVVPLTEDIGAIREGVMRMYASGGGDGPESLTDGLYDLVRLDWRPSAARMVVLVGDAPPHGVEPSGDAFPQGCPCGHHWYNQAENCREMGVVIHAVGCLPGLRCFVGAEEVFKTIARTARGMYLPLTEAHLLIPLITAAAESELDKQRIAEDIAAVVAAHLAPLRESDDPERIRFITEVLQGQKVRPRAMEWQPQTQDDPAPLRFRDLGPADVEEGLARLRRLGRAAV